MEYITSRTNATLTHVRKLMSSKKYRREQGQMVSEGPKMLKEAMISSMDIHTIIVTKTHKQYIDDMCDARSICVPDDLMSWLSDTKTPQGVIFCCSIPELKIERPLSKGNYIVLDGVQDPGNVGTIWRTADAFSAEAMICLEQCADLWSPKTVRSSMGACFRLQAMEFTLDDLYTLFSESEIPLYATALRNDALNVGSALLQNVAVVIGSEGKGISENVLSRCDKALKIPMNSRCESLNASVAASVILWEMQKQQDK